MKRHLTMAAPAAVPALLPAVLSIILLLSGCGGSVASDVRKIIAREGTPSSPVTVRVQVLEPSGTVGTASYVGTVEASRSAVVQAQNPGTLSGLTVKEGARVHRGQVLARVESGSISSAWDAAKASLDQAEDGWERISKVRESGSVSEVKVVEVRTKLEQARASEKAAAKSVENMTVRAPFDGVVDKVYASDGIECSLGESLLSIVDTGSSEIHFPLPENEYSSLQTGASAIVEVPALGRTFSATVASKGVVASPLAHSYDCVLKTPGAAGLLPGMVCKVQISSGGADAFVIPASAVMTDSGGRYVWTVSEDDLVGRKYVEVGGYSGTGVVATAGLGAGEKVIIEGSRKVSTGMKVACIE